MPRRREAPAPSGRCVLVVDDNAEYLAATAVVVAGEGHHVLTAKDGPEALAILRERTVDLILVDYSMPVMNGEQFIDELRRFDRRSPVVLQTGYATERPAHEMLVRLDIQGYHDKTEGPDKLRLWVAVGLKAGARASV